MNKKLTGLVFGLACLSGTANADYRKFEYEVTVTNITKGQYFTPILAATHKSQVDFFELGEMATPEIEQIAEGGNIAPLKEKLDAMPRKVADTVATEGLLAPGASTSFSINTHRKNWNISLAAMLLPTNDTFVAIDSVKLPLRHGKTVFAHAYDAGTETNTEYCADIPGPMCGGSPFSPEDDGEGFVHLSAGIHGEGELSVMEYDWRGPVAKVTIKRVYH